jgi:hypothetical protein
MNPDMMPNRKDYWWDEDDDPRYGKYGGRLTRDWLEELEAGPHFRDYDPRMISPFENIHSYDDPGGVIGLRTIVQPPASSTEPNFMAGDLVMYEVKWINRLNKSGEGPQPGDKMIGIVIDPVVSMPEAQGLAHQSLVRVLWSDGEEEVMREIDLESCNNPENDI